MLIYLTTTTKNEFQLLDVFENAVKKIQSYLNTNEAGGMYQILAKFLEVAVENIQKYGFSLNRILLV